MCHNNYGDLEIENSIKYIPTIVQDFTMVCALLLSNVPTVSAQALSHILIISTGWRPGAEHENFKITSICFGPPRICCQIQNGFAANEYLAPLQ